MRHIRDREFVGYYAGVVVQVHQKENRRRQAYIFNGATASPLPEKGFPRIKDRNAVLDHRDIPGDTDDNNA